MVPRPLADLPWRIILLVSFIAGFGLVVLYSAAGNSLQPWALKQGLRFVVLLGGALVLSRVPLSTIERAALPFYLALIGLLVVVEAIGAVGGGSQRWISLGVLTLQPSELMKLGIVGVLARFYTLLPAGRIRTFAAIWPALALIAVPAALVLIQPDLGTTLTIVFGGVVVMFLAGLPLRLFIGAGLAIVPVAAFAWFVTMKDYQRNRVLTFLDPESDPLGTGYHITQSKIAIGSGGLWGKGFGQGTQSHLDYLPEGHTDFIFATMAEEWGVAGGVAVIAALIGLVRWGMRVGERSHSRFGRLLATGLATTIFFYVAINLMMVMGMAPVVGIPLPLFSWGGSSMMTIMLCVGLLMAIDRANTRQRDPCVW